jgi:hypothetical protein
MPIAPASVRRLFLEPKPAYGVGEVAEVLGMARRDVRAWIESGELEGVERDGVAVPWSEVVSFAMDFWSQEVVEESLGAEVAAVIPELLRLTDLSVRIPRLEVVALELAAAREGESVSALLSRELLDFVSANSAWLGEEIPGFAAAMGWPGGG